MGQSTDKAGVAISPKLPPEVGAAFCRRTNHDLHAHSDAQLGEHYEVFGKRDGRVASPARLRSGFLALVPPIAKILEIGPAHKPCFTGRNVKYFDVQDSDGLRNRALTHNENPKGTPARIDYVSPTGDIAIVRETFDVVFSSHAIENKPDLVRHLIEVDRLLSMSSHNDPARHWEKDSPPVGVNVALVKQALDQIDKAKDDHIDCRAWRMTPSSFREILETLHRLGKSPLRPLRVYDTPRGQNEFFAVLGRARG